MQSIIHVIYMSKQTWRTNCVEKGTMSFGGRMIFGLVECI
jgi:hypothetical protein